MTMPVSSYLIGGHFYDVDGSTALRGATVTLRNLNTNEYLAAAKTVVTNAAGEYTLDAANFTTDYIDGDPIQVLAFKSPGYFGIYNTVIDLSAASETRNITALQCVYTDPFRVTSFLGIKPLQTTPSVANTPHIAHVAEIIYRAEDEIDYRTGHAWRLRYNETESGADRTAGYEYHNLEFSFKYQTGTPIFLRHRQVRTLAAASGDALEVWNGSSYENWLTDKTEGRANDYWVSNDSGMLFLRYYYPKNTTIRVRVKYRYGELAVNRLVEDLATKMTAVRLLQQDDRSFLVPEGSGGIRPSEKIKMWEDDISAKISSLREFRPMNIDLVG